MWISSKNFITWLGFSSKFTIILCGFPIPFINSLRATGKKSQQYGNSSTHYGREKSTKNHQPVSEGISWEARIISSHTAAQKIARKLSFQVTKNDMMVAKQVWT